MYAALFSGDRDSQVIIDEFVAVIGELIVQPDRSCQESVFLYHPSVRKLVAWTQVKAQTSFAYDYTFLDGDDDSAGCFDKKSSGWSACAYSCDRAILRHEVSFLRT